MTDLSFYQGKKILITGHTGFKGSWMSLLLLLLGAEVSGYALKPPTEPSLYQLCGLEHEMENVTGDIRNLELLQKTMRRIQPQIVLHMAAQPIVREGYRNPVYTYDVNVMGTVNILEAVRTNDCVRSFLNVTTDKVYRNREWQWGYRECEELNGYDPYSNSKSCSELVTSCYRNSFFGEGNGRSLPVSTARAGNVIGGGDFAADRIIPDCVRAMQSGETIVVRNPHSIRPYQHVLDPVTAYLMILQRQYENPDLAGNYNVGPSEEDCWNTGKVVSAFCKEWECYTNKPAAWIAKPDGGPHEANFLKLDSTKIKTVFGWTPRWNVEQAIGKTVEWYVDYLSGENIKNSMEQQIREFLSSKQ